MNQARYWEKIENDTVRCLLCPNHCSLENGETGKCGVRFCNKGALYTNTYGLLSGLAVDPIEKKPLYHFYPGTEILSFGSFGCTMKCQFCQNSNISQIDSINLPDKKITPPLSIVETAIERNIPLIAFTYNEPTVFFEYMVDVARFAIENSIETVAVTNGYICKEPLSELLELISAFNVDLKSYDDNFYRELTGASRAPVLRTLEQIMASGKHLEITYLVIPGINDDTTKFREMVRFLSKELGKSVVLHISRYFPRYRMTTDPTPLESIGSLLETAKEELDFVYTGNTGGTFNNDTYCPSCNNLLISRRGYFTSVSGMKGNKCLNCNVEIEGKFKLL